MRICVVGAGAIGGLMAAKFAEAGEEVIIARAGKPLVKVIAVDTPAAGTARRLGFMEGQITIPDDFDRVGAAEIQAMFDGDA